MGMARGIDVIYGGAVSLPTVTNWWSDVRALLSVLCCVALSLFVVRRRGRIAFNFIIHSVFSVEYRLQYSVSGLRLRAVVSRLAR